jgi:hypothetical protein
VGEKRLVWLTPERKETALQCSSDSRVSVFISLDVWVFDLQWSHIFNIVLTFCGWLWRISMRPHDWQVSVLPLYSSSSCCADHRLLSKALVCYKFNTIYSVHCDHNDPYTPTNVYNLYKIVNHPYTWTLLHVLAINCHHQGDNTKAYETNTSNLHTQFNICLFQCINGCEVIAFLCYEPPEDGNLFVETYVWVSNIIYTFILSGAFVGWY